MAWKICPAPPKHTHSTKSARCVAASAATKKTVGVLIGVNYAEAMLDEELHGKHQADENQGRDAQPTAVFIAQKAPFG